jgi:putative protease
LIVIHRIDMDARSTGPTTPLLRKPELLAPAGDFDCVRAAVENGADAVYFGLQTGFNARARAANFPVDELPAVMEFLHRRGVKGYVTLNTLVFPSELEEVEKLVREVAAAGVDAVLVQDLGLVRLIRGVCPDLPIHASTQMSLTSAEGIEFAGRLGVERVVLARELSIHEIAQIRRKTEVELEVFVHGALCVAYSGQCLTSESFGGRSANRGQCAQACRLPYELVCDGEDRDLGDQKYLLSPQDLAAYDLTPDLIAAGVSCFKIEGRLKTAEYVANITRHYRTAIDAAIAGLPVEFSPREVEEMELSFSRGFSHGWLEGCDHKMLVPALSSTKRGVLLGEVVRVKGSRVTVMLNAAAKPGDGVVFEGNRAEGREQGGRVYEVFHKGRRQERAAAGQEVELAFGRRDVVLSEIHVGLKVWKTDDPELTARWRKTFAGRDPQRRVKVDVFAEAAVGRPLSIVVKTEHGHECRIASSEPLAAAVRHPLTCEILREQLGRLGGTPLTLRRVEARIDGAPMVPLSVLGRLRREMIQRLGEAMAERPVRRIAPHSVLDELRSAIPSHDRPFDPPNDSPVLYVLCRTLEQLNAALAAGERNLYAEFQDIREYGRAVEASRAHDATIFLATPRIEKPGEQGIFRAMLRHGADGVLVRNLGGLVYFREREVPVVADFSLNAANEVTAGLLREEGAARITPSYDLNRDQLLDLVSAVPPQWLEVVVHQNMPMFHMEHCVFCAVLSPGTNKTNCGRPCDLHEVKLRDRIGMEHPLKADVGCRNTLYSATPQSAAEVVPQLLAAGVRCYRIELLDDPPRHVRRLLALYRDLLAGRVRGKEVWSALNAANRVGVTRGTLEERRNPLAIV